MQDDTKSRVNSQKNDVIYYKNGSFWHDVELRTQNDSNILNYVVEILPYTREKMEVNTEARNNPIQLDRIYPHPIPFTYGCLPKTYEDPEELDPILKIFGDDDPLDVCDVSNLVCKNILKNYKLFEYPSSGQIKQGIIIGMLAIRDKGEADWKIIMVEKKIYDLCDKKNILDESIKTVLIDWYESDHKSEVLGFYEDTCDIQKVMEHTQKSYDLMMKKKFSKIV